MKDFTPVYIPAGVPTFHLESAKAQFEASAELLRGIDAGFAVPDDMLLSIEALDAFLGSVQPDLVVFQNLTFANSAYISAVMRRVNCPASELFDRRLLRGERHARFRRTAV